MSEDFDIRVPRHRRGRQAGQSLVIFALIAVVLFGIVGIGVDGGFSYFMSDRLERAAMSGALGGVPNMPNFSTSPNDATSSAIKAVGLDGWTSGGASNVVITVAKVTDPSTGQPYNNRLSVTVAADVPTFFMKLMGFGAHRESRTAVAEYLRPITFGQPGSQLGADLSSLGNGTSNGYYFMRSEGWGTDRGQGDAYGPNPTAWGGGNVSSAPYLDEHALNSDQTTETSSQPFTLPARGGQSYQVYVPAGQTTTLKVYNPVFAPDNGTTNSNGYTYHEDDGDFPETGAGCKFGSGLGTSPCAGPSNIQQWPLMSYTVYKSGNPFDHTSDTWLSNVTVQSVDATSNPNFTVPGSSVAAQPLTNITGLYHSWMDITKVPTSASGYNPAAGTPALVTAMYSNGAPTLSGGASGTTYRLRVDQLDSDPANLKGDPGANGRPQNQNSQAHKGYAVQAASCATCTVTALDDVTLYTPVKAGGFNMPLVSVPPEYAGRSFSLYVYDPGDVTCNSSGCSNLLSVMRPTAGPAPTYTVSLQTASTSDGIYASAAGGGATSASEFGGTGHYNNVVAGPGPATVQTQNQSASPSNVYNGHWLRFDITVPTTYATDIAASQPSTWFWYLNYNTAQPAGDTITANLGFSGAPVHLVSG